MSTKTTRFSTFVLINQQKVLKFRYMSTFL